VPYDARTLQTRPRPRLGCIPCSRTRSGVVTAIRDARRNVDGNVRANATAGSLHPSRCPIEKPVSTASFLLKSSNMYRFGSLALAVIYRVSCELVLLLITILILALQKMRWDSAAWYVIFVYSRDSSALRIGDHGCNIRILPDVDTMT
jgi:hypothetical protein